MRRPRIWRDRSWEDRAWYLLLLWNLVALIYLIVRTPSGDAAWVYRVTLWADIAALAWWVGRSVQAGVARFRDRQTNGPAAGSPGGDAEADAMRRS